MTHELYITYDGIIAVEADTEEEAVAKIKELSPSEIIKRSSGTVDVEASGINY